MPRYSPRYKTSFTVGGGVSERALRNFEGLNTESLKMPGTNEEWEEAMQEFDAVNQVPETMDPDNDQGMLKSIASTGMDVLLGIPRGVVGAGMGVWQLADWASLDLLPDWKTNPLGKSKTAVGGIIEGLSNFATGFIPLLGWFGRAGAVTASARHGSKIVRGVKHLHAAGGQARAAIFGIPTGGRVVKSVWKPKFISIENQARLQQQGWHKRADMSKYGRWLAASVATDFTVFRAHEQRFADWLQQFPGMQQPVFAYLASDKDDTELEGRMKNVLEGLLFEAGVGAVGGLVKGTIWGIKAMKRGSATAKAGGSPDDIKKSMESTPDKPEGDEVTEGSIEAENQLTENQNSPRPETTTPATPREDGAEQGYDRPIADPEGLAATEKLVGENKDYLDPANKNRTREDTQLAIDKTTAHINTLAEKPSRDPGLRNIVEEAKNISGTPQDTLQKLNNLIKNKLVKLQRGEVKFVEVPPHQRMKPRDMDTRLEAEQKLVELERAAVNASTYRKTLENKLESMKDPGRLVDIPDYQSASWKSMSHPQQVRELRKRILDAEFGYIPHGAQTVRLSRHQSRLLGNITSGILKNINLYDATGSLNVHEVRSFLETLHEEERAYLKGLVGLPGGRTSQRGSGKFSEGLPGDHQKRILAAGLEHMNDPNFRPAGTAHRKLTTAEWEGYVERIWEDNDIDLTNSDQVQKAMGMGEELATAAAKTAKLTHVLKILQQGYYLEIAKMSEQYQVLRKAKKTTEAHKLGSELIASFFNLNIMAEQWVRSGAMTGHALEARKAIDITEYLKTHDYIGQGLDEIIKQVDMLVTSGHVPEAIVQQYKRGMSLKGKLVNATLELWTNALISGPKTIFGITTVGNVFGMMYFPFERLLAHGISGSYAKLTGHSDIAAREFGEAQVAAKMMTAMVLQSNYSIRGFSRGLATNRSRSLPGSTFQDTLATGPKSDRQAFSAEAFWSPKAGARNNLGHWEKTSGGHWEFQTTQPGAMLDYLGGILNIPGRTMRAMDEVFKTVVVRSTTESELAAQALKYIVHGRLGSRSGGIGAWWTRTTGEGRETVTNRGGKLDLAKREAQDKQLHKDWEVGGPRVGKGQYADEFVLFEEITAEVNGKMYKMIDENGTVYTKARVSEDMLQKVMAESEINPNLRVGSLEFKQRHDELVREEWNPELGAIGAEAEKMALKSTWQEGLTTGQFSHTISKLAQTHPVMRLVFPFIKTPRNLLKFVSDRNPVNPNLYTEYMRHHKDAAAAFAEIGTTPGAEQAYRLSQRTAAELLGRASMSSAFLVTSTYLASSGVITGSGPKNYQARKNLLASGWQPYSFRIGNKYYSYARAEPLSTYLGLMADAVEISNHTYDMDYGETPLEMVMKASFASLMNNITDKTYLMGLSNILNAAQEPERYTQRVFMSYMTSVVPFSSFMYQTKGTYHKLVNEEDMYFRKAKGYLEPFQEKMGWNNSKVPLAYDLMGKPVKKPHGHWPSLGPVGFDWLNPFTVSQKVNDPVYQAVVEMKLNDGPPKGMIRGRIDVRDEYREGSDLSFYDSWQETTGKITLGGRTLHETMDRLVRHKDWKRIPKLSTEGIDSPARNIFRSIIQKYRRAAFKQTMDEYSTTRNKYLHALEVQRQLRQL